MKRRGRWRRADLAGRAAAAAARAAAEADAQLCLVTNYELLMLLIRQVMPGRAAQSGAAMEAQARAAVAEVAPLLSLPPERVATILEELAALYAPIGVGMGASRARIPVALERMARLRAAITAALRGPPPMQNPDADLVAAAADLTLACARHTVGELLGLLADLPGLLRAWVADPAPLAARLARPDWLLDGWDRIGLLWDDASADREAMFAELADLVPAMPREVSGWIDQPAESAAGVMRHARRVQLREDWRSGVTVHQSVLRNERLLALTWSGN